MVHVMLKNFAEETTAISKAMAQNPSIFSKNWWVLDHSVAIAHIELLFGSICRIHQFSPKWWCSSSNIVAIVPIDDRVSETSLFCGPTCRIH